MNEAIEFKTIEELYKRLKPALYSKTSELKRKGIDYIKEEDIWNYLMSNDWKMKSNLTLAEMTSDILYLDDSKITTYVMSILKETERIINVEEEDLL